MAARSGRTEAEDLRRGVSDRSEPRGPVPAQAPSLVKEWQRTCDMPGAHLSRNYLELRKSAI
jgi:hypothetical protein